MKILHIIPGLSNSSGPTQSLYYLTHHLAERGHEVSIGYISGRNTSPTSSFHPAVNLHGFPARWLKYWGYSPELAQYLDRHIAEYDVVHIHSLWLYPNIATSRAAARHGVPYIIRPAGSLEPWCLNESSFIKRGYLHLFERNVINGAAIIHTTSRQEAEHIQAMQFNAPSVVVPNGIEVSDFQCETSKSELRKKWNLPPNKKILLFLSRIHPKKNLEMLGEIFKNLLDRQPEAFLVVAGPDQHEYAQKTKKHYQTLGLSDKVRFTGEVSGRDKAEVYQAADVFVLPSFSENFGIVTLEAMAAGLPAVVSEHMPWEEINRQQAGFCLPLDTEAFVDSLDTLLTKETARLQMAENAEKLARAYDWSKISQEMEALYKRVSAKDGQPRSQFHP